MRTGLLLWLGLTAAAASVTRAADSFCVEDADQNFEVGLSDFTAMIGCLSGPRVAAGPACEAVRFDRDTDVDLADFARLQNRFGPCELCKPRWAEGVFQRYGTNEWVSALAVFDDGNGPALYVGGGFTGAGGIDANRIAKWDGSRWAAVGSAFSGNSFVSNLLAFDDGGGSALYAAGGIALEGTSAGGVVKWNGRQWSAVRGEVGLRSVTANALAVFDDGSGPALHAAGWFTGADGTNVSGVRLAKWDGMQWSAVGHGVNNSILTLAVFDDGTGPALYAGGFFTMAGGIPAGGIAKWNGTAWAPLGDGVGYGVYALTVFDDGTGPGLYAGGTFTIPGDPPASYIAKWDGKTWSALDGTLNHLIWALSVFNDGTGEALYATGSPGGLGTISVPSIAKWDGKRWSALGGGLHGDGGSGVALTVFDDGSGPALIVGGRFKWADQIPARNVAKWDGRRWSGLGGGMGGEVYALHAFDDGSGPALYAGGTFTAAGGVAANRVAKFDGRQWSPLGGGMNDDVTALTVFDDGTGPALYACGKFTEADGAQVNYYSGH
jgi:hypothetical protein